MPTREQVTDALRAVIDPELRQDIVTLEMVRSRRSNSTTASVDVIVSLTTPGCPIRNHFQTGVVRPSAALEGVTGVNVSFDVLSDTEKQAPAEEARPRLASRRRAGAGPQRDLRRLGQGRRRQVERHRQPRRGAGRPRASRSASSTPTSGATRSRACSGSAAERADASTASARSSRSAARAASR